MNNVLRLKGSFESRGASAPGPAQIPKGQKVTAEKLRSLQAQLTSILDDDRFNKLSINPLVSVRYRTVVAKSNRVKRILSEGSKDASGSIVGARFESCVINEMPSKRHVITHYVSPKALRSSIELLETCATIIEESFGGAITNEDLEQINRNGMGKYGGTMSKTAFAQTARDSYYAEEFFVTEEAERISERAFVSLYKIDGVQPIDLLARLGIEIGEDAQLDECVRLWEDKYEELRKKAPFLIAMSTTDIANIPSVSYSQDELHPVLDINHPQNEPIIGVIDTAFNTNAYFSEWVTYEDWTDKDLLPSLENGHGTMVSSIIVDGPRLNPALEDGCGRFRVKHFGVMTGKRTSSFSLMKKIQRIVNSNPGIKVWNLSLGDTLGVPENAISPSAAILDKIQAENDLIFVIAGTNLDDITQDKRIGSPADSINSIVVNAANWDGTPADYSRQGPVLSFFCKPDIAYYGGTSQRKMVVSAPYGLVETTGTSFAAPWIARKLAFLIYKMRLSREAAKALIIDSAIGWGNKPASFTSGYGVPPVNINDILKTPSDEIRFIVSGNADSYETYNYRIPVPTKDERFPFLARATLCYFPKCSRNQGVDYTQTELDLHFGRLYGNGIKSLDKNSQGNEGSWIYEETARHLYRKWDNVKHVGDQIKGRMAPRKTYDVPMWGLKIRKKERLDPDVGAGISFSVVVSLKEMSGRNRIEEFIQKCYVNNWLVTRINVENEIKIYEEADVEISFED